MAGTAKVWDDPSIRDVIDWFTTTANNNGSLWVIGWCAPETGVAVEFNEYTQITSMSRSRAAVKVAGGDAWLTLLPAQTVVRYELGAVAPAKARPPAGRPAPVRRAYAPPDVYSAEERALAAAAEARVQELRSEQRALRARITQIEDWLDHLLAEDDLDADAIRTHRRTRYDAQTRLLALVDALDEAHKACAREVIRALAARQAEPEPEPEPEPPPAPHERSIARILLAMEAVNH